MKYLNYTKPAILRIIWTGYLAKRTRKHKVTDFWRFVGKMLLTILFSYQSEGGRKEYGKREKGGRVAESV